MPIFKLKLIDRKSVARGTIELVFEKPQELTFKSGQYGGFTLINPVETDDRGITRRFSLLNAPHEKHVRIATRIQNSAYKKVLNELPLGSEIKFAGPTGNFTLHEDVSIPAVFIAGGIGITPFYSMIQHAIHCHSTQQLILFYGNQSIDDAPYLNELQQLQQDHPNLKLIAVMANPDPAWQGETGFITYEMIKRNVADLNAPIFYVCGSPAMVNALRETLKELDISDEKIKVEDFPGY